ncbi:V-type proton ATPase subunit H [Phytophthora cinnamomi]|uniref:V-type proton ATPase subunit H n=1 Tax=Phytophthora cinnamomi TaxID=4785 RepID=UPI00355A8AD6|nr:V-type proton ATPase subunit H [Phytophthora cinnamomi]
MPEPLQVKSSVLPPPPPIPAKPKRRKRKSKLKSTIEQHRTVSLTKGKFRVRGLVTIEELEDEDEADEVQEEVRGDFERFGEVREVVIVQDEGGESGLLAGDVVVEFRDAGDALKAFAAFDGKVFGGKAVTCAWSDEKVASTVMLVQGMLTPEELEDPDEVEDVKEELMQTFTSHGTVNGIELDETTGVVTVTFSDSQDAEKAVMAMNNSRYGGRVVAASLVDRGGEDSGGVENARSLPDAETKPIVQPTESPGLQNLVGTFLTRLVAFQKRAHALNPRQDKRSRRLVLGLHEVRRGLLNKKLRLLVIASDLEGCDAVAEKFEELVAIAAEQEVPLVSPMNRRKLGRVLQKKVRVSCVGVYSVEGANEVFQQILKQMDSSN